MAYPVFSQNFFCETVSGGNIQLNQVQGNRYNKELRSSCKKNKKATFKPSPQVNDVVLVVPLVQMNVMGINEQEAKEDEQDL